MPVHEPGYDVLTRAALLTATPLAVVALAAGCTGGTPAAAPASSSPGEPTSDPGDGDMLAGQGDGADWATMVQPCPGGDRRSIIVQQVVTADVTGDGTHDALVVRSCRAATSYVPSTVEVFDGASSSADPRRVGTLLADVGRTDRPWVTRVRAGDGVVVVEANGVDRHSDRDCPDLHVTYRYRYGDGTFRRDGREVGNAARCLPAG